MQVIICDDEFSTCVQLENYIEKYSNIKSIDNLYNQNLVYKRLILNKYKKDSSN